MTGDEVLQAVFAGNPEGSAKFKEMREIFTRFVHQDTIPLGVPCGPGWLKVVAGTGRLLPPSNEASICICPHRYALARSLVGLPRLAFAVRLSSLGNLAVRLRHGLRRPTRGELLAIVVVPIFWRFDGVREPGWIALLAIGTWAGMIWIRRHWPRDEQGVERVMRSIVGLVAGATLLGAFQLAHVRYHFEEGERLAGPGSGVGLLIFIGLAALWLSARRARLTGRSAEASPPAGPYTSLLHPEEEERFALRALRSLLRRGGNRSS